MHEQEINVLKQIFYQYRDRRLNMLSTINYLVPSCAREEAMMEKIMRFKSLWIFISCNCYVFLVLFL